MEYTNPTLKSIIGWVIVHCHGYHYRIQKWSEEGLDDKTYSDLVSYLKIDMRYQMDRQYVDYVNYCGNGIGDASEAKKWEQVVDFFKDIHKCDYKDPNYDPSFAKMSESEYIDCHRCNDDTLFTQIMEYLNISV